MTEPYPSTEVESKLKHLFRSLTRAHRAYKDTRNHALILLHRASAAVLTAVLVYKALTYLLFLPAMNGIWSLTLRCSPVNYLANNNAHQIFTSPTILGGIVLIVLLAACWNLYGFSILLHGFALAAGVKHCVLFPCSPGRWGISAMSCSPRTGPSCFTAPCSSPLQMYS